MKVLEKKAKALLKKALAKRPVGLHKPKKNKFHKLTKLSKQSRLDQNY